MMIIIKRDKMYLNIFLLLCLSNSFVVVSTSGNKSHKKGKTIHEDKRLKTQLSEWDKKSYSTNAARDRSVRQILRDFSVSPAELKAYKAYEDLLKEQKRYYNEIPLNVLERDVILNVIAMNSQEKNTSEAILGLIAMFESKS